MRILLAVYRSMAGYKMMPPRMRQSLLAGLVVAGVTAAMAAVPTGPLDPVTTGASAGTINIDEKDPV